MTPKYNNILIAGIFAIIAVLAFSGCGTLDKTGVYQGDQSLYAADVAAPAAFEIFNTFVTWEYQNRATLASRPEVTKAADYIRANAPAWKKSLIALREQYASNPTPESRKSLLAVLGLIQAGLTQVSVYLIQPPTK